MNKLIVKPCFFGQHVSLNGAEATRSVHFQPLKTRTDPLGNTVDILSISVHDREQNAIHSKVNVVQVSNRGKKIVGGMLAAIAVGLGIGGVFCPPLLMGAITCGVVSIAVLVWGFGYGNNG